MTRLTGISILPRKIDEAKELVGKSVIFLRKADIDYSGRGHSFPRYGVIKSARYKYIEMDNGDIHMLNSFVEMVEHTPENFKASVE